MNKPMETDQAIIDGLREGNSDALRELMRRHHTGLKRLARKYVPSQAIAEEVVQDVWMAVLRGIDRFEGRSSLKTWVYRILVNRAHTTGAREKRYLPAVAIRQPPDDNTDPMERLIGPEEETAEDFALQREVAEEVRTALTRLPDRQQKVVQLRDLEGRDANEVADEMGVSEANQRVLLHRGRRRLKRELMAA